MSSPANTIGSTFSSIARPGSSVADWVGLQAPPPPIYANTGSDALGKAIPRLLALVEYGNGESVPREMWEKFAKYQRQVVRSIANTD
jgi:hypothetical protein